MGGGGPIRNCVTKQGNFCAWAPKPSMFSYCSVETDIFGGWVKKNNFSLFNPVSWPFFQCIVLKSITDTTFFQSPSPKKTSCIIPIQNQFLYQMVAHFTMRIFGLNQVFRFIEGIGLHRKTRQIRKKSEKPYFASYVRNML